MDSTESFRGYQPRIQADTHRIIRGDARLRFLFKNHVVLAGRRLFVGGTAAEPVHDGKSQPRFRHGPGNDPIQR
jgi:hypothetical protein